MKLARSLKVHGFEAHTVSTAKPSRAHVDSRRVYPQLLALCICVGVNQGCECKRALAPMALDT